MSALPAGKVLHQTEHPLSGQTVALGDSAKDPARGIVVAGAQFEVEDWWDRLGSGSWMDAEGNFAAMHYAMRSCFTAVPLDDEVVYGHIGDFGHIVHVSELGS